MRFEPARDLAGIVLAAGASSRLGRPKQLVLLRGQTLIARAAALARSLCGAGVIVVTGAHHDQVLDALQALDVTAVYNPRWREGMGASLRLGAAVTSDSATGLLVMLSDQPLIDEADMERLVGTWCAAPDEIAAAAYRDCVGVPAIFPRRCLEELKNLRGDKGAKQLLDRAASLSQVEMPNAAFDLDTPDALVELSRRTAGTTGKSRTDEI